MNKNNLDRIIEDNLKWLFEDFVKDEDVAKFYKGVIKEMLIEASNMKKAEIIKNGNVNLKTVKLDKKVKVEIDWDDVYLDFGVWKMNVRENSGSQPTPTDCFFWLKERLS